jgi:hypothetical protein
MSAALPILACAPDALPGTGRPCLGCFALRWRRSSSLSAAAARFSPVARVWVSLGSRPLAAKTLAYEGWKNLDFLGFSRPKPAFSIGYEGFSLKIISRGLCHPARTAGTGARDFGLRKGRIGQGAIVTKFCFSARDCCPSRFLWPPPSKATRSTPAKTRNGP